jgi:RNA polymerase sigma-70 factor (ECF subfamily)
MSDVKADSARTARLLDRIADGDGQAMEELLARYQPDLLSFVECHLDPRLRARFSESDVVQEAQMEVVRRIDDFLRRRPMPFHLWARKTAYQRLLNLKRDHRQRARRSIHREVPQADRSAMQMVRSILCPGPTPSARLAAHEAAEQIGRAVAQLTERDRDILLMRQVEDLPYEEIAALLDVEPAAARKRYGRALIRLQAILKDCGLLAPP